MAVLFKQKKIKSLCFHLGELCAFKHPGTQIWSFFEKGRYNKSIHFIFKKWLMESGNLRMVNPLGNYQKGISPS